jgi:hypothetical protein
MGARFQGVSQAAEKLLLTARLVVLKGLLNLFTACSRTLRKITTIVFFPNYTKNARNR